MSIRQPIFIIGSPRSGTSLLRLLLTSHSEIVIPPECGFIVWLHQKYSNWAARDAIDSSLRCQFLDELFACKKFDTWALNRMALDSLIIKQKPADYATLCALIYTAYSHQHSRSTTIWGDKNNFYIDFLPTLNEIYPEARFLHIVRDGRDVACSYREVMQNKSASPYAPKLKTDIESIAIEWSANVLKVADSLNRLSNPRKMTVHYEDMVQKPESVLSSICSWLSLTYEPRMLAFHEINRRKQLEPALTMDWKQRTMEPISADTVGRYRTLLSAEEQDVFSMAAGPALTKFDYTAK
jgi:hypothetical protein